jgi:hypothetical protein
MSFLSSLQVFLVFHRNFQNRLLQAKKGRVEEREDDTGNDLSFIICALRGRGSSNRNRSSNKSVDFIQKKVSADRLTAQSFFPFTQISPVSGRR